MVMPAQAITSNTHFIPVVPVAEKTAYTGVFEGGAQAYTGLFVCDNPVNMVDPSGHDDIGDIDLGDVLDTFSIGGLGAQIETLARSTALTLNTSVMNSIVKNAMSDIGSWKWSTAGTFGKYGPNVDKCNLFWAYEAKRSGAYVPNTSGTRFYGLFDNNPPTALQLGDPMFIIYDWPVIKSPVPGAVVAGGDHVGIVASDDVSSISVFHGQYIINNDWAFRTGAKQTFKPVFRGYTGW
jgi:hypothetical protein